jgi:hypothetical protein
MRLTLTLSLLALLTAASAAYHSSPAAAQISPPAQQTPSAHPPNWANDRFAPTGTHPPIHSSTHPPTLSYRDAFYFSDRFGYRITWPSSMIITPSESALPTQPARPLEVLELWNQADFPNRANLPETPPLITITVYDNARRLPLSAYKGELSRNDDRAVTIAGQRAVAAQFPEGVIAYTATGLYESDNVLFASPNGRYVFRISGGYMDANAPIRQTFQQVVSSFSFDVLPRSTPSARWRINYSRLQGLLRDRNWRAADLETRAILQRLAGPSGDFLYGSATALSRVPPEDLRTLDTLWSNASGGRFGFTAQQRVWRQVVQSSRDPKTRVDRFAQAVGWRGGQLPENPLRQFLGTQWRLDTDLNNTAQAPVGHFPWVGISSERLSDIMREHSMGCGSCVVDAMVLANERFYDYLPALFGRLSAIRR